MSQQVVTPPAAALRDAVSIPGQPVEEEVCMWPSTRPGKIRLSPWEIVAMAGGGIPLPDRGDGFAAHRDITLPNDRFGGDDGTGDHAVEWC